LRDELDYFGDSERQQILDMEYTFRFMFMRMADIVPTVDINGRHWLQRIDYPLEEMRGMVSKLRNTVADDVGLSES
jgi:hypothetical protein